MFSLNKKWLAALAFVTLTTGCTNPEGTTILKEGAQSLADFFQSQEEETSPKESPHIVKPAP